MVVRAQECRWHLGEEGQHWSCMVNLLGVVVVLG